jgi:cytochrome oxidase assembly protein ShyY1
MVVAPRVAILVIAAAVAALCVRLGFWQLDRLQERRASNDRIRAGLAAAPVVLDEAPGSDAALRRASAIGTYDVDREVVLFGRALEGRSGDHLLTPLRLSDGSALLVDRGWVPTGTRSPAPEGEVEVRGFLLPPDSVGEAVPVSGRVTDVDPDGIGRTLSYELAPVYLLLQVQRPPADGLPIPAPLPELSEGPHLSYAIQWFSFAAVAVIGGVVLLRREGRVDDPVTE